LELIRDLRLGLWLKRIEKVIATPEVNIQLLGSNSFRLIGGVLLAGESKPTGLCGGCLHLNKLFGRGLLNHRLRQVYDFELSLRNWLLREGCLRITKVKRILQGIRLLELG